MGLSYWWSRQFLTSRRVLWMLFIVNFLGTVYGYEWYWKQMQTVAAEKPLWMLIFVPDSPTASLFFTLSLLYLLADRRAGGEGNRKSGPLRKIIEMLAAVASFKYGIWAVTMIVAGNLQGTPGSWEDWMLSISHLGMAAEAILFFRFYTAGAEWLMAAAVWVLGNDAIDYGFGVYPWLPLVLEDEIGVVAAFTILLSFASLAVFALLLRSRRQEV